MAKKVPYFGLMLSLALIISYLERLIPFDFFMPGIRIGLTNIVVVFVLYYNGAKEALFINMLRVFLANTLFGSLTSLLYGLFGGILSWAVMCALKRAGIFGAVGISAAGGVFHNIGQVLAAMLLLKSTALIYYVPVLMFAGLTSGIFVGVISYYFLNQLGKIPRLQNNLK
ncbi:MAG: Gx transporter family protein [Clostridiaceae bacterium]|nr:Gx transporter family protein [Clostridiaceae bacterium]